MTHHFEDQGETMHDPVFEELAAGLPPPPPSTRWCSYQGLKADDRVVEPVLNVEGDPSRGIKAGRQGQLLELDAEVWRVRWDDGTERNYGAVMVMVAPTKEMQAVAAAAQLPPGMAPIEVMLPVALYPEIH